MNIGKLFTQGKTFEKVLNICSLTIHDTIQPLYNISKTFYLWPYKYDKDNRVVSLSCKDKILRNVLNIVLAVYLCWSVYGRLKNIYNGNFTIISVTDIAFGTPLFLLAFISISLNSNHHGDYLKTFYEELHKIDKQDLFFSNAIHSNLRKQLKIQICMFYVLNVTSQLMDIALFVMTVGFQDLPYYIGSYIIHNLMIVVFFQIKFEAKILHKYFGILNQKLVNCTVTPKIAIVRLQKYEKCFTEKAIYIRRLCLIHKKLCNLIETTSNVHGIQIIALICCVVCVILNSLFYGVITGLGEESKGFYGSAETAVACNQVLVVCMHIVLVITLAGQCSTASKEALKTGRIANDMLLKVSIQPDNNSVGLYRKQLKILLNQAYCRNPTFSAAGCFDINYSIVITIIGASCSYFIILLQFKNTM